MFGLWWGLGKKIEQEVSLKRKFRNCKTKQDLWKAITKKTNQSPNKSEADQGRDENHDDEDDDVDDDDENQEQTW